MTANQPEQKDIHRSESQYPPENPQEYPPETYEILVQGHLDSLWRQWFEGMGLSYVENGDSGAPCTLISGEVADQAALHGLLIKIRDLNLKLISVRRIMPGKEISEEVPVDLDE